MYEFVETIECVNDKGVIRNIDIYEKRVDTSTFSGKSSTRGLLWAKYGDTSVNIIDEDTFEIISIGEIVTRK